MDPRIGAPSSGTRLKARWRRDGLPVRPGTMLRDLDAFDARYGVRLHPDVRGYFGVVDGQDEMHSRSYVRFWPLRDVKPLGRELGLPVELGGASAEWFILADYLIWSHAYAIRLSTDPAADTQIGFCSGTISSDGSLPVIASSFREFVDLYLADSPRLYDPWGREDALSVSSHRSAASGKIEPLNVHPRVLGRREP